MGERRLVSLLKELLSLNWGLPFYKHFTATRFFPQALRTALAFPSYSLTSFFSLTLVTLARQF
jgi:hypothetical protein